MSTLRARPWVRHESERVFLKGCFELIAVSGLRLRTVILQIAVWTVRKAVAPAANIKFEIAVMREI